MRPLHEQFLDAVATEQARLSSRRRFLGRGAKVAGGGALAIAVAGMPGGAGFRLANAQEFTDDLDILNFALTLELLESTFYQEGLDRFGEEDFADAFEGNDDEEDDDEGTPEAASEDRVRPSRARIEEILVHEEDHVATLTETITALGGTPVGEGDIEFDFDDALEDVETFLETARAFENTGVGAYNGAAPFITDPDVLGAAATIATVEGRHAGYLNLVTGESPFPQSFDDALTRDEVLGEIAEFIVAQATPEAAVATEAPVEATATAPVVEATETPAPAVEATEPVAEATETPAADATDTDVVDTDGDGLTDDDEANVLGTYPTEADTDGDGAFDGDEVVAGTDPLDPADF